jgi:superfamily II DNA or RNA helicase
MQGIGPMSRIKLINNTRAKFIGTDEELSEIAALLSVEDPSARFTLAYKRGHWDGMVRFVTNKGYFPIGLTPMVYNYCKSSFEHKPKIIDKRRPCFIPDRIPIRLGDKKLRDYQIAAVRSVLSRTVGGVPFPRGIISAATNAGKSLMAAALVKPLIESGVKVLSLCHKAEIFDQMVDWYGEYLETDIGRYRPRENDIRDITVAMITTLHSRRNSVDVDYLLEHYDCLIVDECHHASAESWARIIGSSTAYIKLGLSGTALQSKPHRNMALKGILGPVLSKVSSKQLVDEGYSATPCIRMLTYKQIDFSDDETVNELAPQIRNLQIAVKMQPNNRHLENELRNLRRMLYAYVYMKAVCLAPARAKKIADIAYEYSEEQILIVVNKKAHGRYINKVLAASGINSIFVCGEDSDADRGQIRKDFARGKIRVLVATMIYKEGIDIPAIDVLVIALGEKAPHSILQTFGRGLRTRVDKDEVLVYDFQDLSYRSLAKHTNIRLEIYEREKFKVKVTNKI